ncbi:hypothetical protein [Bradyrhizobium lablabi]
MLLKVDPARCYEQKTKGEVEITLDSCIECGDYRVLGEPSTDIS